MMDQPVDQGIFTTTCAGMHHQARRLVQHDDMGIRMDHIQRPGVRFNGDTGIL